jgi:hypothetical protein
MATLDPTARRTSPAVVTKAHLEQQSPETYLLITPAGRAIWVEDPQAATTFASMREGTRMAMRLPSSVKAFSLPREPEIAFRSLH